MKPTAMDRTRRGFALLAALGVVMVVAVALLAIAASLSADGRRTYSRLRDAQLEQMLLAGAIDAKARLAASAPAPGASWTCELPPDLTARGAVLSSTVASSQPESITLTIEATLEQVHVSQTLQFRRADNAWQLASATLQP